ncbi:hypothetical protein Q4R32_13790 [Morganella morganii]
MKMTMEKAMALAFEELLAMDSNDFVNELIAHRDGDVVSLLKSVCGLHGAHNYKVFSTMKLRENAPISVTSIEVFKKMLLDFDSWQIDLEAANDSHYLMAA